MFISSPHQAQISRGGIPYWPPPMAMQPVGHLWQNQDLNMHPKSKPIAPKYDTSKSSNEISSYVESKSKPLSSMFSNSKSSNVDSSKVKFSLVGLFIFLF